MTSAVDIQELETATRSQALPVLCHLEWLYQEVLLHMGRHYVLLHGYCCPPGTSGVVPLNSKHGQILLHVIGQQIVSV